MYHSHFRFNLLWAMKAVAGSLLAMTLLTTSASAQVLIGSPYVTGFEGWTDTYVSAPSTQVGANPSWGVLLTPDPFSTRQFLFEAGGGAEANGTTTANVAEGNYKPYMLVNMNPADITPATYALTYELATVDNDGFGLVFGYQDNDNYFRVGFREQTGGNLGFQEGTSVQKVVNGTITQIANTFTGFVPSSAGTPFNAKVVVDGSNWDVQVESPQGAGFVSILSGTDADLQPGRYGVHSWQQREVSSTASPQYGSIFGPISVASGTLNKTTDFVNALSAVPWRRLLMTDAVGGNPVVQADDVGNFAQDFTNGTIRDDSAGFANATASAPNIDFVGPAIVVDGAAPAAMTDYRFTTRLENGDVDGIGLLFRVADDGNFYRVNWASGGTTSARPPQGMSIQKFSGFTWTEIYRDTGTPQFVPSDSVPFDVSVQVVGDTFKIDVLNDPGGENERAISYAPIQDFGAIANGSVGFTNWGNGDGGNGVVYSAFRGEDGAALVTQISAITDFSLTVDRQDGVATFTNENASSVNVVDVSIRSSDGNLISDPGSSISGMLTPGQMVNLGDIWTESRLEDVVLEVELAGGDKYFFPADFTGGPNGTPYDRSDLNTDGMITAADWSLFFPNMLTDLSAMTNVQQVLAGDLDLDGDNDVNDFILFKKDYELDNGAGSFDQMIAGVPEPSTFGLLFVVIAGAGILHLRGRRKTRLLAVCGLAVAGAFSLAASETRADVLAARIDVTDTGTNASTVGTVLYQTPGPTLYVATDPPNIADLTLRIGQPTIALGGTALRQENGVIIAAPNKFQYDSVSFRNIIETPGEFTSSTGGFSSFGYFLSTFNVQGSGVELNYPVAMAHFPFADGWIAGHVRGTDGVFFGGNTSDVTVTTQFDNPPTPVVFGTGHYKLEIAGVDSRTDGMLFAMSEENASGNSGNVAPVGILPDGSGWDIRIHDQGAEFPLTEQADWSFVYIPYGGTANLRAAGELRVSGSDINVVNRVGAFGASRVDIGDSSVNASIIPPAGFLGSQGSDGTLDTGRFLVSIPGKDDTTGYLMVGVADYATSGGNSAADDNMLTWEYNAELGGFLIESYDLPGAVLQNSNTYFAYFDYAEPIELGTPDIYQLTAEVNRADGTITIKNTTGETIGFDYYQLDSAAGSLNEAGWNSLDEQNFEAVGGGIGESFDEAGGSSDSSLAEVFLLTELGVPELGAGLDVGLGAAYNNAMNAEDLVFRYRDQGVVVTGLVSYIGIAPPQGVPGDYNDDGVVNAADYVVWRDNLGNASANLPNDSTPTTVDAGDYQVWRSNFGGQEGAGSGANANVPEPSSVALMFGLALLFSARRFGRRFV